jgi:hypothetical protein
MKLRAGSSETCLQRVGGVRGETAHSVGWYPRGRKSLSESLLFHRAPGAAVDTLEHMFAIKYMSESGR